MSVPPPRGNRREFPRHQPVDLRRLGSRPERRRGAPHACGARGPRLALAHGLHPDSHRHHPRQQRDGHRPGQPGRAVLPHEPHLGRQQHLAGGRRPEHAHQTTRLHVGRHRRLARGPVAHAEGLQRVRLGHACHHRDRVLHKEDWWDVALCQGYYSCVVADNAVWDSVGGHTHYNWMYVRFQLEHIYNTTVERQRKFINHETGHVLGLRDPPARAPTARHSVMHNDLYGCNYSVWYPTSSRPRRRHPRGRIAPNTY